MRAILESVKEAAPFDRILSFVLIINCIQMSVTAVKMVNAGFVAIKTALGLRFGCPDCKIILSSIPDPFDSPQAFHEYSSPNCPQVLKAKEEEATSASDATSANNGMFCSY